MNVDQNELDKFANISSRWWDPDGEFKALHQINPIRMAFTQEFAELKGKKVLDVGCGGGLLSEALAQCGAKVTGLDVEEKSLEVAKLHLLESKLKVNYHLGEVEKLATEKKHIGKYDVITCMEMLEHVFAPESIIKACATLLKPGGYLVVSTINRNPLAFLGAIVAGEYILRLLPKGTHHYEKFIKPSELIAMGRANDLAIVGSAGIAYNPLTKQYSRNDALSINYMLAFCKP